MEIIVFILGIMLSPAIILFIIGRAIYKRKPKTSKILYIIATVYAIIGLGVCGTLLSGGF